MPYRLELPDVGDQSLDRLIELRALDVERVPGRAIVALMPDSVLPDQVAHALGVSEFGVSAATGRDADSTWILSPRPVLAGRLLIVPAHLDAEAGALKLVDAKAFGTGLHPTTALCLEVLDETLRIAVPDAVLDVGTGSGVLALAALTMGVPRAMGIDIDDEALRVAKENAGINGLGARLQLARGGPEALTGSWPLVLANVLAAALIEMAPALTRRVAHHGRLVLSGIPVGVEDDVGRAFRRLGMRGVSIKSRAGWVALVLQASW